jgi:hypothetical protein
MKNHTLLKAMSIFRLIGWHLRIYVKIKQMEQGKLEKWSFSEL